MQNGIAELGEEMQVREVATAQQLLQQYQSEINSKDSQIQKLNQKLKEKDHGRDPAGLQL